MYQYQKDYTYYEELYDKLTIEKCQRWENNPYQADISKLKGKEKKLGELKNKFSHNSVMPLTLLFLKIERAAKKSDTIQEWMERDRNKDEKLTNAREPEGVRCFGCSSPLKNCVSRDLMDNHQEKEEVLFMFECDKCGKRRAFWENGKEWEHKPTCGKCKAEVQISSIKGDNVITTEYHCSKCGHVETDTLNLNKKEEQVNPDFEANRKKYCLSESMGRDLMDKAECMSKVVGGWEDREKNKELYEAAGKIKKLTVVELQNLLNPAIEKAGYSKLEFEKPEIEKNVILGFSLQDAKTGRDKLNSEYDLKRLIKATLEDTNWRLMSDGVNYRLGFLIGRLNGVESEEDILKLVLGNKARQKLANK
ncbi:MAG: hypothetical protein WA055_04835 [Candidatus Moraniibacteriota bacterium]